MPNDDLKSVSQPRSSASTGGEFASPDAKTLSAVAATVAMSAFVPVDPSPPPSADDGGLASRYEARELLGEGGMGEVRLYKDKRVGREVAMKAIRPGIGSRSDLRLRFLREARVQGQLEHPAIVPVYDLSLRPEPAFFTMKRVRGVTLEQVVEELRAGDAATVERFSRRKLLTAFGSVCLAVDFAHAHGVVHRDLKPANVMFGNFGEVYVLDWGVAKVGAADTADGGAVAPDDGLLIDASAEMNAKTAAGSLMGTIGYMAPEQLRGESIDPRADVYALGAMLFEILALAPLHDGAHATEIVASTLRGADARVSTRAPDRDAPPELEAVCVRSTALSPEERYASARELHDAVEQFLDGDRDLELRARMAAVHAQTAAEATERSMQADGGEADRERSLALRELGRALALDPTNASALRTTLVLRMQPPRELPEEARVALEQSRQQTTRTVAWAASIIIACTMVYFPLVLWMGVRDWTSIIGCLVMSALAAATAFDLWRRPTGRFEIHVLFAMTLAAFAMMSRVAGPFVVVPAILVGVTMSFVITPRGPRRTIAMLMGCSAIVLPAALEFLGVLSPSYAFADGALIIRPHAVSFSPLPTLAFLLVTAIGTLIMAVIYVDRVRRALERAERQMHLQAWQLRQLVPEAAKEAGEIALAPVAACLIRG